MKKQISLIIAWFALGTILLFGFFQWPMAIPGNDEYEEASEIYKFIKIHYDIKPEAREGLSGYNNPGVYLTGITIYGMLLKIDQDKLIELLKSEKKRRGWKTIKISFYEKESFIPTINGRKRWKEKLIRTKIIF